MPHYHCVAIGCQNGSRKSDKLEKFPERVLPNASTKKPKHDDKAKDTSKVSTQRGDRTQPVEGSFAPNDFVFEAPENVSSFVFKPLSPSSAASFLYPNGNSTTMSAFTDRVGRTSTPKKCQTLQDPEKKSEQVSVKNVAEPKKPGLNTSTNMFDDVDLLLAKPVRLFAESSDDKTSLADELAAASSQQTDQADTASSSGKEEETVADAEKKRDVTPFREQHSAEIQKLTALADKWSMIEKTTTALSEDVQGQIRTVACQARLLMGEKLKQFLGLVDKCEAGDPYTNCQDLQGFWDMVYIQKFENLDKLQQNNWKIEEIVVKKTAQKMAAKVGT
nr:hypothetical protein BaRGS_030709 [Batillaria attramentaria]